MKTHPFISTATTFVQLRGSDTVLLLIKPIAYQYMTHFPENGILTMAGGTTRGYKTAIDGTTDIGMVSGGMNTEVAKWALKQNVKITSTPIAFDGLAVFVHSANPLANLTLEQLQDIFTGKITNWKQLGQPEGPIQIYTQNPNRGSFETWRTVVMRNKEIITPRAQVMDGLDIVSAVVSDPNGIGFTSPLNLTGKHIKLISINDHLPTPEAIHALNYPIHRALSLITHHKKDAATQAFIQYCLAPDKGQSIIKKLGLVPAVIG
jgi:phosphate transport system substrate-binding protein